jgi:small subunit ribosomal protein S2
MAKANVKDLLEAGVHFGHMTRKWNPNMAPYIFMEKNGIHIVDLHKTAVKLDEACSALEKLTSAGKKVLFVATKKQAKEVVAKHAAELNMPYITERWPGGMLTNFVTIRKAVKKMNSIDKMKKDGTFETLSKKERLQVDRQRANLEKNLGSISDMVRLPSAIFVVDIMREHIAVTEAKKLGIPVFVIPGNDDASKSIDMILNVVSDSIKEGQSQRKADKEKSKEEGEVVSADKDADFDAAAE